MEKIYETGGEYYHSGHRETYAYNAIRKIFIAQKGRCITTSMRPYETRGATLPRYFILDTQEQSFYRHPREAPCALIKERRTIYRSLKSNQTARDKLPSRERNDKLERSCSEFPEDILPYCRRNTIDITKYFSLHNLFSL